MNMNLKIEQTCTVIFNGVKLEFFSNLPHITSRVYSEVNLLISKVPLPTCSSNLLMNIFVKGGINCK